MQSIEYKCLKNTFSEINFYTLPMKVKDAVNIYYVAVRGKDQEEAAVQRVLSKQRIKSVKEFILKGNMFLNTFILNWTNQDYIPEYNSKTETIKLPIIPSAAQVIDGQHRLAGLEEAMKEDDLIGEKEILVSVSIGMSTKEAALIFLNINSEQKPVPKSLIYDLYGVVEENNTELGMIRAGDIATELNESTSSPFYKAVKFPGAPRGSGNIDLSTIVSSLKKALEPDGVFVKYNLKDLNRQKQAIMNYFSALEYYYDKKDIWMNKTKNPFMKNTGFYGAIDFFIESLILRCAEKKSFSTATIKSLLGLDPHNLLLQSDLKGLDGKTARKRVTEFLESNLLQSIPDQEDYEF